MAGEAPVMLPGGRDPVGCAVGWLYLQSYCHVAVWPVSASPLPSAGLYVQTLHYAMKSGESQAEKRLGACRRRFVWRKPFLGRLNDAPVKKHKKDVGERTSIRLFFPESALPNPLENNDNETLMVFVPFKPADFIWLREVLLKTRNKTKVGFWRQPPGEWNGNVSYLRILNPYVIYEATYKLLKLNIWSMRYATTGIIALNLALHVCQEVNIAGFGYPGNHDNATPIHYYNTGRPLRKQLFQHNITAERKWLLKMIQQGAIADIGKPSSRAQDR
ncbi:PREDICTED: CMP-N-acetylneuraminate-beta-galactosamide-alpha-2,3-sialyltransferase 4-like [Tinamus guttatus]|uniref:CMP-N-acetylneuraminate-beta-galactosamide- alpha-2,3-sialyltransferase 4-like n=1 Tax=Tinamus guttatus TaxID=94827 RepID=UPI00052F312B|nr:PREDICTED: CMP-N-acetylneuraminate-beta-galactosamide-alpha-2,3-sialyltransferase 4-like [Tinamus guttatus]